MRLATLQLDMMREIFDTVCANMETTFAPLMRSDSPTRESQRAKWGLLMGEQAGCSFVDSLAKTKIVSKATLISIRPPRLG